MKFSVRGSWDYVCGAQTEVTYVDGRILGTEGLVGILKTLGYPESGISIEPLQEALLTYYNCIRLDDDLTLLEVRFS